MYDLVGLMTHGPVAISLHRRVYGYIFRPLGQPVVRCDAESAIPLISPKFYICSSKFHLSGLFFVTKLD